jgi:phosphatidylethanolamine-binding protein (PEBP) family uncharacterized protein
VGGRNVQFREAPALQGSAQIGRGGQFAQTALDRDLPTDGDDPDVPGREPWIHWIVYKIPAVVRELPEGLPTDATLDHPIKALQGLNSWPDGRTIGYRGPAPPPEAIHHYCPFKSELTGSRSRETSVFPNAYAFGYDASTCHFKIDGALPLHGLRPRSGVGCAARPR